MKKSLLAGVAAVALVAGPAFAQKQEAPASGTKGAAPPPAAIQNAPAEKMAPKGPVAPERGADVKRDGPAGTTGQGAPAARSGDDKSDMKSRPGAGTKAPDKPQTGQRAPADSSTQPGAKSGAQTGTTGQGGAATQPSGAAVNLTTEQRTKVRTTVLQGSNVPRVTNVNFSLNVGTVVPRTVRVVEVPPALVEIHPAWRGFLYFVHGDRIVIVEPGTLRIVTIITV